jgi:acetoin utilization deacetylase AcuC-like enzyme
VPLTLVTSDRFADHLTPPGHPERVERAEVMQRVASEFRVTGGTVVEPRLATEGELERIHDADYLSLIREVAGRAVALDPDTYTSPQTYDVARLAAGAALTAVDLVLDGGAGSRAMALVRPPGHHAERDRAMGFCIFNNVALAAAHARARGLSRVAIVDYDVHHGNGTQRSFYADPSVLFVSSHQFPFYPGTGAASEVGVGEGKGFTLNLPMDAGATDADFELVYESLVAPVVTRFRPELILVSAGFDAWVDDPIGGMQVSVPQFERLAALVVRLAEQSCEGRVVAVSEGGYDLDGLRECFRATIHAMDGSGGAPAPPAPTGPARRGEACLASVRPYLSDRWTL